jgi:glycosyltransferase involved in cell wall biosynthesis
MKFINKTRNSVQLEDIDLSIEYTNEEPQYIDTELVKKSFAFQKMVKLGCFSVIEATEDRVEQNLYKLSKTAVIQEPPVVERKPSGLSTEVILRGHFYDATGYSKVNRNFAMCLRRNGVAVEIDPVTTRNNTLNEVEAMIFSILKKPVGKDAIRIDSVIPTQGKIEKDCYNILYTTTESRVVPKQFIDIASDYNELWVTSEFCKQSFLHSNYSGKIRIIHPIVNPNLYKDSVQPYSFRPTLKSFSFVSVQSWGYRKGSDVLIKAFCSAFTNKDDVSLVVLISERSRSQQEKIRKEVEVITGEFPNKPHICICTKTVPEYQLPSFYKAFNAFVLPSRGEGFGLPYCEASLCGLPVIATNYSGCLDFLTKDNSYLVDFKEFERTKKGTTGIHYWDGQEFPKLDQSFIYDLADSMRYVFNNYAEAKAKNALLQDFINQNLDGRLVGLEAKSTLNDIWTKRKQV